MAGDPRALLKQAQDALDSAEGKGGKNFMKSWFTIDRTSQYEKVVELFTQAASAFAMQHMGKEAGDAYKRAASVSREKLNEPTDEANLLDKAWKQYRKEDPQAAVQCLEKVLAHHTASGDFRRAARFKETLAELIEVDLGDIGRAAAEYQEAARWYESDNAQALANKIWLKTADLLALEGKDYYKAIDMYEKVAKSSVDNNLMRWSIKDYLLKAGICQLCTGDQVGTNTALEKYRDLDPSFVQQREHQLLVDLAGAVEQGDQEAFADKLFQFDQLSKLDKWKTTLLLRVKNTIENQEHDFS